MEFYENRSARPFKESPFRLICQLPYRMWKSWRLRMLTRRALSRLDRAQLRDIGLTCEDVNRFK
ncbi:DUF1127 domain-containing protein [Erwinia mallotivora]|uniref:DUF1127 domain-containing protein n=1 Tax=Erwinia mallotivora TaxID=69222 RepID=UPI0021C16702|nr:DUF1127 domain-containing protein [Erwinia mallotivora]